jgi:hypothetical protein
MADDLQRLREKLCRELAQSERSATVHTAREARRLGEVWPAVTLRAISEHAEAIRPGLEGLLARQPIGRRLGRAVGEAFSVVRHFLFDRLIDAERSFRGTLLGLRHGVDVVRLLREVGLRQLDHRLVRWCDEFLVDRMCLLEQAEQSLAWFAERPAKALASGARLALQPADR